MVAGMAVAAAATAVLPLHAAAGHRLDDGQRGHVVRVRFPPPPPPCNAIIRFRGGGGIEDDDDKNKGDSGGGSVSLEAERWQQRQKLGSSHGISTAAVAVAAAQRR
jgi:hypothetical protein